jgi:hypothetical protein
VLVQVAADGHAPMPRGRTVRTRGRRRPARGNRVGYFCPGVAIVEPVVRSGSTSEWDATPLPHQQAATTTTWNLALGTSFCPLPRRSPWPLPSRSAPINHARARPRLAPSRDLHPMALVLPPLVVFRRLYVQHNVKNQPKASQV